MKIKRISVVTSVLLMCFGAQLHAAPNTEGQWTSELDWPLIAIHAVMTPQGKIFTWGTNSAGVQGAQFNYDLWDPESGTGAASHNTLTNTLGVDSFCSAALMLPESGDILMSGGDARPQGFVNHGINSAPIFDTGSNTLSSAADMNSARWYPTSITLPNGEVLLSGGRDGQNRTVATPEIYTPASNTWRSLLGIQTTTYGYWYPRLWVAPDGRVFAIQNNKMYYMNTASNGSLQALPNLPNVSFGNQSSAVMYSPGKILQVSGNGTGAIVNGAVLVDITGTTPVVRETSRPSQTGRRWSNTVVLPDGKVILLGGSSTANALVGVAYKPEIWDPATEQWTVMAAGQRSRLYHSTALLLKDGRVMVGGGGAPGPEVNTNVELFSPPYLFNSAGSAAARPTITHAPDEAPYGAKVLVAHPSTDNISRVTLIKTGAVTHSFNMEQRFIELDFADTSGGVRVDIPTSANIATPGHYMMFLINNQGVPSEGHIVRISNTATYSEPSFPVAITDNVSATTNTAVTIDVLSNDTGGGLSVSDYNRYSAKAGTITKSGNQLIYKSAASFSGTDTFWYVIKDSLGRTNSTKVSITVTGTANNPFPVGTADSASTNGSAINIDVLANDIGNGLTLDPLNRWSRNGGTILLLNGKMNYTPKLGFTGEDKAWYTFTDVQGRRNWGEVTITVTSSGNNPHPSGNPDTVSASSGSLITIDALANDVGTGLILHTPSAYSQNGGSVALVNNKFTYRSASGFTGADRFWYTFEDTQGRSNWSSVSINVSN